MVRKKNYNIEDIKNIIENNINTQEYIEDKLYNIKELYNILEYIEQDLLVQEVRKWIEN